MAAVVAALTGCGDPPSAAIPESTSQAVSTGPATADTGVISASSEDVGYHNPNTGYSADYVLDVDYGPDGQVERINFDNGGWEDDFVDQRDNANGTVTVTDEDGREFTVASHEPDAPESSEE